MDVTAAVDYASVGDQLVILAGDELVLLDSNFVVVSKATISLVYCRNMMYNDDVGILLFCISKTGSGQ